jgi:hypothetical protein
MPNVEWRTSEYGIIDLTHGGFEVVEHVGFTDNREEAIEKLEELYEAQNE